mgnify:CR=1 FL=1
MALLISASVSVALPACPSDQTKRYHNCFGTYIFGPDSEWAGDKYVGEFKDGKNDSVRSFEDSRALLL